MRHVRPLAMLLAGTAGLLVSFSAAAQRAPATAVALAGRCEAIGARMRWPVAETRIVSAAWRPAGPFVPQGRPDAPPPAAIALPAHCEIVGAIRARVGVDGQRYAIRFHVRLPEDWNGRFFMQGGGGTNGELGDAVGRLGAATAPALVQGFAVVSQDSGHDNAVNTVADRGGASAFGFDPQARADYGGASLPPAVRSAKALVRAFYGRAPSRSYFVGCSKGGQEGMMLAQRYPDLFDGIVANAPGFALPRAAVAEMWNTQAFARVVAANGETLTPQTLARSFSAGDFALARAAILAACDGDDGARDGIVGAFARCTSARVLPELAKATCRGARRDGCLSAAQVDALHRVHEGPRDRAGRALYAAFPWDGGWGDMAWRMWTTGVGPIPPLNVMMGAPSLAAVFSVPPRGLPDDLQRKLDYAAAYDFDRDAAAIYATGDGFERSAWRDIGARSADLDAFRRRGGRLMVAHGVSDPVFSVADTIDWFRAVQRRHARDASGFVRVFAVPGMAHCGGGPATDDFDQLRPLMAWVEHGVAPDRLVATAGPASPWPGRRRLLCPFPAIARYMGKNSLEDERSFTCATPDDAR